MKRSSFLSLIVLFLLQSFSFATADVEGFCPALEGYYVPYNDCLAVLNSDPSSRTADNHGLAVISINLTIANATRIMSKLEGLVKKESDPSTKNLLESCLAHYSDAMPSLRWAKGAAEAKNYAGAAEAVFKLLSVTDACDQEFYAKKGVMSPVMKENNALNGLIVLAHAANDYLSVPGK